MYRLAFRPILLLVSHELCTFCSPYPTSADCLYWTRWESSYDEGTYAQSFLSTEGYYSRISTKSVGSDFFFFHTWSHMVKSNGTCFQFQWTVEIWWPVGVTPQPPNEILLVTPYRGTTFDIKFGTFFLCVLTNRSTRTSPALTGDVSTMIYIESNEDIWILIFSSYLTAVFSFFYSKTTWFIKKCRAQRSFFFRPRFCGEIE